MAKRVQLSSINTFKIRSTSLIIRIMLNIAPVIIYPPQKERNRPPICFIIVWRKKIIMIWEIIRSSINKMISCLESSINQSILLILQLHQTILFLTPHLLSKIVLLLDLIHKIINQSEIIISSNPSSRLKLIDPPIGPRMYFLPIQLLRIHPTIASNNLEP